MDFDGGYGVVGDTVEMETKAMVVCGDEDSGGCGQSLAGRNQSNGSSGKARVKTVPDKDYILLPLWTQYPLFSSSSKDSPGEGFKPSGEEDKKDAEDPGNKDNEVLSIEEPRVNQKKDSNVNNTYIIYTVSLTDNADGIKDNVVDKNIVYGCVDDPNMPNLEEIVVPRERGPMIVLKIMLVLKVWSNAPSIFKGQIRRNFEAYLDDMIIKSKFLKYIVTSEGIRANPQKTKVVMNMPSLSNLKQIQSLSDKLAALNRGRIRSPPNYEEIGGRNTDPHHSNERRRADGILVCRRRRSQRRTACREKRKTNADPLFEPIVVGSPNKLCSGGKTSISVGTCSQKVTKILPSPLNQGRHIQTHQTVPKSPGKFKKVSQVDDDNQVREKVPDSKEVPESSNAWKLKQSWTPHLETKDSDENEGKKCACVRRFKVGDKPSRRLVRGPRRENKEVQGKGPREQLNKRSVDIAEVNMVVKEEGRTWMTPIREYLDQRTLPDDPAESRTLREKIGPLQANYVVREIHMGSCGMYDGPIRVVHKAMNVGYYWPSMHKDVNNEIKGCDACQAYVVVPRLLKDDMISVTSA
nr:hypothetical protein [Tanacetum cinerariifolium]